MGLGRLTAAVADAGPLIHLAEIGALSLLRICDGIVVPRAVWDETVGQGRVHAAAVFELAPAGATDVPAQPLAEFVRAHALDTLHRGEQQCLFVCNVTGVSVIFTDDLAARDAARRLGLTPVGSLGIVVRSYRLGDVTLDEAEHHIEELQRVSTLFVTGRLVDLVLDELRRAPT